MLLLFHWVSIFGLLATCIGSTWSYPSIPIHEKCQNKRNRYTYTVFQSCAQDFQCMRSSASNTLCTVHPNGIGCSRLRLNRQIAHVLVSIYLSKCVDAVRLSVHERQCVWVYAVAGEGLCVQLTFIWFLFGHFSSSKTHFFVIRICWLFFVLFLLFVDAYDLRCAWLCRRAHTNILGIKVLLYSY